MLIIHLFMCIICFVSYKERMALFGRTMLHYGIYANIIYNIYLPISRADYTRARVSYAPHSIRACSVLLFLIKRQKGESPQAIF